ncbi:MAG: VCBS repeat-containing protein [Silvibacterium sp.]
MPRMLRSCTLLALAISVAPAALPAQTITFAAPKTISFTLPDSAGVVRYSAADFTGNGKTDYLLEAWNQGDLLDFALLIGDGSGNFTLQETNVPIPTTGDGTPGQYRVADVNYDGKADIITFLPGCQKPFNNNCSSGTYGTIKVYLNQGGGRFINTYTSTLPQFLETINISVGYFNGDRLPDVAVLSTTSIGVTGPNAALTLFLNKGDGLFTRQADTNLPAGMTSFATSTGNLVAGDFTGNGREDLVFSYDSEPGGPTPNGLVYRLPNNGTGSFGTPVLAYKFGSPGGGLFATGDLNDDGRTDLIYAGGTRDMIALLANTAGGFTLGASTHYYIEFVFQWALADVNGDGKLDLAIAGGNDNDNVPIAAIYPGIGNGTFNLSYKAIHPSGGEGTIFAGMMAIAPLAKGDLPSVMFLTGPTTLELYVNKTVK